MPILKGSVKRKSKVFITGIAGFAGSHLAELLLSKDYELFGLLAPRETTKHIKHLVRDIRLERFDILKGGKLSRFINKVKPEYLFHLAAVSSVGQSFENERLTYDVNFTGSLNVIEAACALGKKLRRLIFISSADIYGIFKPKGKTLTESQPFNPVSPYGISKAAAERLARYYFANYDLPVVIVRPFNHTGPRHSENFAVPSFCKQIAGIETGHTRPQIKVGDLSPRRDLSDVRDIVHGYHLSALKGKPGAGYHLCSERSVAMKTVLEKLLKMSGIRIKVCTDKDRFRKSDIPVLRGDCTKVQKELGWQRYYTLDRTLKDTLRYWREKIGMQV